MTRTKNDGHAVDLMDDPSCYGIEITIPNYIDEKDIKDILEMSTEFDLPTVRIHPDGGNVLIQMFKEL